MDDVTIALLGIGALAALAALSPIRIPLAIAIAMLALRDGVALDSAALVAGVGGAVGRALLGLEARRERSRLGHQAKSEDMAALRERLKAGSGYPRLTFIAALTPVVPVRFLFGVLGAMRLPMRYALMGALVGQTLLLWLGSAIFAGLARWVTSSDTEAAQVLGITAIIFILMRVTRRIDWDHWRTNRRLRMRAEGWEGQFMGMVNGTGVSFGTRGGMPGASGPMAGMGGMTGVGRGGTTAQDPEDSDPDVIDAEAVEDADDTENT